MQTTSSNEHIDRGEHVEHERLTLAPLDGRFVCLRAIEHEHYVALRRAELGGNLGARWRFRGSTPSPETWSQQLWQSVLAQFLVYGARDRKPVGLVALYRVNFQDQHAYLAAESFAYPEFDPRVIFGIVMFVDYVFASWALHKVYLEVPAYNLDEFASGVDRLFTVEGRLREHIWSGGRRWDQINLAIYREAWKSQAAGLRAAARTPNYQTVRLRTPPPGSA